MKQRYDHSGEILQRTLPDVSLEQESKTGDQLFSGKIYALLILFTPIAFILVLASSWAAQEGLELIWADAPAWASTAVKWIILIGISFMINRVVNRRRKHQGKPTTSLKEDVGRLLRSLLFFLLFIPPLFWVIKWTATLNIENPILMMPIGIVPIMFVAGLLFLAYTILPHLWIITAAQKGNYERALRRVLIVQKLSSFQSQYKDLHGGILLWMGRCEEAEQVLRAGIVEERKEASSENSASVLNMLGYALMGQGKYEEAVKMFAGSIAIKPSQGAAYDSLAEAYLSQNIEEEQALALLDRALENRQSWLEQRQSRFSISETWAGRAWALARLKRRAEAYEALEKALAIAPRKDRPAFASILYRAGRALTLLGETEKAAVYFEDAHRLAPERYGPLCAEALSKLHKKQNCVVDHSNQM